MDDCLQIRHRKKLLLPSIAAGFFLFMACFYARPLMAKIYYTGKWKKLSERVYLFKRKRSSHNSAILMKDFVIMIDAGQEPESGKYVVDKLRKITDKPIKYLVITHYHDDHIMAIPWFKKQGTVVIGHSETQRILTEMGHKLIANRIKKFSKRRPELKEILKDAVVDNVDLTFDKKMTIGRGKDRVELLYFGPARTPGDLFLWLPKEKILFTGDAINKSVQPIHYDYPNTKQWTTTLRKVLKLGAKTYIAQHGKPFKTDTVMEIINYYTDLRKGVQAYIDRGVPLKKIQKEFQLPKYKKWRNYKKRFKIHIMVMYKELTGQTKKFYDIK
ncbi:MAG: MBL fold metallo-hydrolase [Candidatus Binatia bacterium]